MVYEYDPHEIYADSVCSYCGERAHFTETVWADLFWCINCEEDAAWEIYSNAHEQIADYENTEEE
tara:strand:+ start:325 stop:519 length:195 start_codon:yes stop_codon:yes gene_type:complete